MKLLVILSSRLYLSLPIYVFRSGVWTKLLHPFLSCSIRATCLAIPVRQCVAILTILLGKCKLWSSSLCWYLTDLKCVLFLRSLMTRINKQRLNSVERDYSMITRCEWVGWFHIVGHYLGFCSLQRAEVCILSTAPGDILKFSQPAIQWRPESNQGLEARPLSTLLSA
jgi:hypothetical protein